MKLVMLTIGKKDEVKYAAAVAEFSQRTQHYFDISWKIIPSAKNTNAPTETQKKEEGQALLKNINSDDFVILLDERGNTISSVIFAELLQKHLSRSTKRIVFIIGGAFGVSDEVWKRTNFTLSFGKMVFPHQIMRLLLIEQIYRAGTIIKGEKYHHQ
jgi:23S rRNA (pseudouridine1915-N3)-methyltransferase